MNQNFADSHETLIIGNMKEFCPRRSLSCRIFIHNFVNSWYATDAEDFERDSFGVSMFYYLSDGTKVVIYEDTEYGVYARPKLEPLDIDL